MVYNSTLLSIQSHILNFLLCFLIALLLKHLQFIKLSDIVLDYLFTVNKCSYYKL